MNLPNKLSLFRIILVPVIAVLYLLPVDMGYVSIQAMSVSVELRMMDLIVLALFAIASFTDFLDGNIARKRNLITSFGKFIDPIADKLLVNTMLILFAVSGVVSVIPVIVMIWRDMIVDGLRMNASNSGIVVAAGWSGKVKTVLQMLAIIVLLLGNLPFAFFAIPVDQILLWSAMVVSVMSGIKYFIQLKDVIMESM